MDHNPPAEQQCPTPGRCTLPGLWGRAPCTRAQSSSRCAFSGPQAAENRKKKKKMMMMMMIRRRRKGRRKTKAETNSKQKDGGAPLFFLLLLPPCKPTLTGNFSCSNSSVMSMLCFSALRAFMMRTIAASMAYTRS